MCYLHVGSNFGFSISVLSLLTFGNRIVSTNLGGGCNGIPMGNSQTKWIIMKDPEDEDEGRALPDIMSNPEVRRIFKVRTVRKPDFFLAGQDF